MRVLVVEDHPVNRMIIEAWLTSAGHVAVSAENGEIALAMTEARPFDLAWARSLRDQCKANGTAFFMKQLGSNPVDGGVSVRVPGGKGDRLEDLPPDLQIRQFPAAFGEVWVKPPAKPRKPTATERDVLQRGVLKGRADD